MTRFGLDSTSEVPAWAHHQVGSTVALRYLSRYSWKVVTRSEHKHYRANGIDLALVFEDGAQNALGGYDAGKADAEFSLNQAHGILGIPREPAKICAAVDYDPAGNAAATDSYFDGWAAVMTRERTGPYGGIEVISRQADRGFKQLWQTYAWSGGAFDRRACLYQYSNGHQVGGVDTDFNHVYGDFGAWDRGPIPPADPHHYLWFPNGPFAWQGHTLRERDTVIEYDRRRFHPHLYARRLGILKWHLRMLAARVYYEAHRDHPPSWGKFSRGWRYQQLIHRAQGKKLV